MLTLELSYDRWFYDVESGNKFRPRSRTTAGSTGPLEELIYGYGGWATTPWTCSPCSRRPTTCGCASSWRTTTADDPVEGAVDEVWVEGVWVDCQDYTPPAALAPNPVGDTLRVGTDPGGHTVLAWDAPAVDAGHDAATLYRIERANTVQFQSWDLGLLGGSERGRRWHERGARPSRSPRSFVKLRSSRPKGRPHPSCARSSGSAIRRTTADSFREVLGPNQGFPDGRNSRWDL